MASFFHSGQPAQRNTGRDQAVSSNAKPVSCRRRVWKGILIALGAVLLVLGLTTVIYLSDYYHAEAEVTTQLETLLQQGRVQTDKNGNLIFLPKEGTDKQVGFVFYPGGKVEYIAYAPLMEKLSERGITCYLVKMPGNLAIFGIDKADTVINAHPETGTWYIGGHSLGGAAASMFVSEHPSLLRGLLLLGAYSSKDISQSGINVLSLYGSEDRVMNREKYEESLPNLPVDYREIVIDGGCHGGFGCYGVQEGDGTPSIGGETQQSITADTVCQWVEETR